MLPEHLLGMGGGTKGGGGVALISLFPEEARLENAWHSGVLCQGGNAGHTPIIVLIIITVFVI